MKLCKDCDHFSPKIDISPLCSRHGYTIEPVWGVRVLTKFVYCRDERKEPKMVAQNLPMRGVTITPEDICGPDGKYWVRKEQ